jgi:toxin secretion/phage lysis holin
MKHLCSFFHWLWGFCLSVAAFLLQSVGGWDAALGLLLGMMALDVITGLFLSFTNRSGKTEKGGFLSRKFFQGISRKFLILLLVALGTALDGLLNAQLCRVTIIGFYAANEALSIIENAALAGVPFPKGILQALERYRNQLDHEPGE